MRGLANRIVHARMFEYLLVVLFIGCAAVLGLLSFSIDEQYEIGAGLFLLLTLVVLVLEVILKMIALSPRVDRYFRDGWNAFDFLAISFLVISIVALPPPAPSYGLLIMLVRLLRLLRGLSTVRELHLILSTLIRSVPSVGHVVILLCIILYAYALVGHRTFGEHDPARWGDLGVSALSLFQVMTMDDWVGIMHPVIELEPLAWIYFVSFLMISAFIVANILIAVVIRNLEEARKERLQPLETPTSREEILQELRSTQQALHRLEQEIRARGQAA